MEKPYSQKRVLHIQLHVQSCDGDKRHLQRNDLQTHQQSEEPLPTLEVQPGEGISSQSRQHDRQDRGGNRHYDSIQKGPPHSFLVEQVAAIALKLGQGAGNFLFTIRQIVLCAAVAHEGICIVAQTKVCCCSSLSGQGLHICDY